MPAKRLQGLPPGVTRSLEYFTAPETLEKNLLTLCLQLSEEHVPGLPLQHLHGCFHGSDGRWTEQALP